MLSRGRAVALKDKLFGCKEGKQSLETVQRDGGTLRTAPRKLKASNGTPSMEEKKHVIKGVARSKSGDGSHLTGRFGMS